MFSPTKNRQFKSAHTHISPIRLNLSLPISLSLSLRPIIYHLLFTKKNFGFSICQQFLVIIIIIFIIRLV